MVREVDQTRYTLIQKLQEECNEASWDEFISLYRGYVFVIVKKMNFNDQDCHDIMQNVFLKVWKNVQGFEHGGRNGQFRRWLAMITRNSALNHITKSKRESTKQSMVQMEQQVDSLSNISEPEIEKMAEKEWGIYIANVAWENIQNSISETLKSVFVMSIAGKSRTEISEALELPANTVSVYKRRVKSMLRQEIKRLEKNFG